MASKREKVSAGYGSNLRSAFSTHLLLIGISEKTLKPPLLQCQIRRVPSFDGGASRCLTPNPPKRVPFFDSPPYKLKKKKKKNIYIYIYAYGCLIEPHGRHFKRAQLNPNYCWSSKHYKNRGFVACENALKYVENALFFSVPVF